EDDEDRDEGDEQQDPVDAGEGFAEVRGESGRAGDVDGYGARVVGSAAVRAAGEGVGDGGAGALDGTGGVLRWHGQEELQGLTVVGGNGRRGVCCEDGGSVERVREIVQCCGAVVVDAIGVGEDDDRGPGVVVAELVDDLPGPGGLRG